MKRLDLNFSKNIAKTSLMASAFVIAFASPAGAVTASLSAQSAQASLDQFKQKITTAIDTSISKLQDSAKSLDVSISLSANQNGVTGSVNANGSTATGSVNKDGASGSVNTPNGGSANANVNKDGASANANSSKGGSANVGVNTDGLSISLKPGDFAQAALSVPKDLKSKLQESNQKAISKLKELKAKVEATASVEDLQTKAKEFDQEFKDIAAANIQAAVTKAIDSQTKVLDGLQVAASNLQTRVNKLKECLESVSASATGNVEKGSATGSVNASAPGCTDLNIDANSGDQGQSLQDRLNEIKSTLQTIRSFLSSTIALVTQLKDGNYTGTIKSFSGISAQVDIVVNLSSEAQNDLLNLSAAVNK